MSRDGRPPQPRRAATPVPKRSKRPSSQRRIAPLIVVRASFVVVLVCVLLAANRAAPGPVPPPPTTEVGWPVRAAFYYPWFPESEHWATRYTPSLGKYDSSNPRVLATHVAQARYAGLDAFIASYWGQGTPTARRLPLLLDAAVQPGLPHCRILRAGVLTDATLQCSTERGLRLASPAGGPPSLAARGGKARTFRLQRRT